MHNGFSTAVDESMPVTLTVKHVPERIAEKLRLRAAASHRSLQGELMAILAAAVLEGVAQVREPPAEYAGSAAGAKRSSKRNETRARRLTLAELWERSRRLGPASRSESAAILRRLRDERHGR
jgi:plasmid stability protein